LKNNEYVIRPTKSNEISKVAKLLAKAYEGDIYYEWCVPDEKDHHIVIPEYYKIYLGSPQCVSHVAEDENGEIVGATIWLPHDTDPSIYSDIDKVTGVYAPMFNQVADLSHLSEPPMEPFYQLVGFGVLPHLQGLGIGQKLLKYQLDILDKQGIPTYLEASTPYYGKGVYAKFDYQPVGELMVFTDTAVLYPLWRPAKTNVADSEIVSFGRYKWQVLDCNGKDKLLLSKDVLELREYNDRFENTTWSSSTIREYLNSNFYNSFTPQEQGAIYETSVQSSSNAWYDTDGGSTTFDKIFILSISEAEKYLGEKKTGCSKGESNKFYIDDSFNQNRGATYKDGSPSRWYLRTPGKTSDFVATVTIDGKISVTGDFVNRKATKLFKVGVRPAMWVRCRK
jgi:GNAT superfamily N-acetyltransferase